MGKKTRPPTLPPSEEELRLHEEAQEFLETLAENHIPFTPFFYSILEQALRQRATYNGLQIPHADLFPLSEPEEIFAQTYKEWIQTNGKFFTSTNNSFIVTQPNNRTVVEAAYQLIESTETENAAESLHSNSTPPSRNALLLLIPVVSFESAFRSKADANQAWLSSLIGNGKKSQAPFLRLMFWDMVCQCTLLNRIEEDLKPPEGKNSESILRYLQEKIQRIRTGDSGNLWKKENDPCKQETGPIGHLRETLQGWIHRGVLFETGRSTPMGCALQTLAEAVENREIIVNSSLGLEQDASDNGLPENLVRYAGARRA